MTLKFRDVLDSGGGSVVYVWNVSGYPWAVTNSPAAAALLQASSPTSNTTAIRRKIFGNTQAGGGYIADDEDTYKVYPMLRKMGTQTWESKDLGGVLSGGDYSVEVDSADINNDWDFGESGDFYRGLPGLHNVAYERFDESIAWGYLNENFVRTDTSVKVVEQNGTLINTRVNAAGGGAKGYRLLWVGQECLAVTSSSTSGGVSTIGGTMTRNCLNTREQDHWTEELLEVTSVVKDMPGSIKDKICNMWALVINRTGDDFIEDRAYHIRQFGKVQNVNITPTGVCRVSVGSPFTQLDTTLKLGQLDARPARYVFTRYEDSGTTSASVWAGKQCPHLVVREFSSSTDNVGTEKYLWLCDPDDSVIFDSLEEVYEAIGEELELCRNASPNQHSGNSGSGDFAYVSLGRTYSIVGGRITCSDSDGTAPARFSVVSGPCAWLFNLGYYYNENENTILNMCNQPDPWFNHAVKVLGSDTDETVAWSTKPWMVCSPPPGITLPTNWHHTGGIPVSEHACAKYLYQWQWRTGDIQSVEFFGEVDYFSTITKMYFEQATGADAIASGDELTFGTPQDVQSAYYNAGYPPRYARVSTGTTGVEDNYDYITIDSSGVPLMNKVPGNPTPFRIGASLQFVPAWEVLYSNGSPPVQDSDWQTIVEEKDPWLTHFDASINGASFPQFIKAVLGDIAGQASSGQHQTHINGFLTVDDTASMVDWTQIINEARPAQQSLSISYKSDLAEKINLLNVFKQEMLLHGLAPFIEWNDNKNSFQVGARRVGILNASVASSEGRTLTEGGLLKGKVPSMFHNAQRLATEGTVKANFNGDNHQVDIPIKIRSAHFTHEAESANTYKVTSDISHIGDPVAARLWFWDLLMNFSLPYVTQSTEASISAMLSVAVGKEFELTDRSAKFPFDGSTGVTSYPVLCTKMAVNLDSNRVKVDYRYSPFVAYGWAPACYIAANDSTKDGSGVITCTPTEHQFSESDESADQMRFDCYGYNKSTGVYIAKDCGCGDYKVIAIELETSAQTLMEFDVTEVDVTTPKLELTDLTNPTDTHYNNWDVTKPHVIFFAKWDDCEDCQKKWIFAADSGGKLGSGDDDGFRYV